MPGFIKDIGGSKRMRFVRPGHDPNNLNLDPNQVIFDSETIGNLSVLDYGENFSPQPPTQNTITTTQLRAWSLPYAPMVIAQFRDQRDPENYWSNLVNGSLRACYLESSPTGLWFVHGGGGARQQYLIRWTAFRFPI